MTHPKVFWDNCLNDSTIRTYKMSNNFFKPLTFPATSHTLHSITDPIYHLCFLALDLTHNTYNRYSKGFVLRMKPLFLDDFCLGSS